MSNHRRLLNAATARILRGLVRVLLRYGVTYESFSELAKHVYVEVAEKDFPIEGRKVSASRISTLTGIHRREVARLRALDWDDDEDVRSQRNRAANVLSAWLRDERFLDQKGDPLDLPFDGPVSFSELVKRYSGDVPPRAIADELMRLDTIEEVEERLRLVARAYVPAGGSDELFEVLGTDTAELIDTIDHNMTRDKGDPSRYLVKVSYDNVPVEYADVFRKLCGRMAQRLLEELDRWLADHDRDHNADILGTGRAKLGLTVFQVEQIQPTEEEGN